MLCSMGSIRSRRGVIGGRSLGGGPFGLRRPYGRLLRQNPMVRGYFPSFLHSEKSRRVDENFKRERLSKSEGLLNYCFSLCAVVI